MAGSDNYRSGLALDHELAFNAHRTAMLAGLEFHDIPIRRLVENWLKVPVPWGDHDALSRGGQSEAGGEDRRPHAHYRARIAHRFIRSSVRRAYGPASPYAWRGRTTCSSTS